MTLGAPYPYFGGKSGAAELIWSLLGDVDNYVEPFAGSLAALLLRPNPGGVETVNDWDANICNFWRAIAADPDAVAHHADWPVNETDLHARHSWLVRNGDTVRAGLDDPEWYDPKAAGWWVWGACNWIGSGWCSGNGPWVWDGSNIVDRRQLPHLSAGRGINRQLPHLGDAGRGAAIAQWFNGLSERLRDVRVCCGDWTRALTDSVTVRHGLTGVLLDPPYDKGNMDYGAGGMGQEISTAVREWCIANGSRDQIRIVLCGHAGEHDALLNHGWAIHKWKARKGYALTNEAIENSTSETIWASPNCLGGANDMPLFAPLDKSPHLS